MGPGATEEPARAMYLTDPYVVARAGTITHDLVFPAALAAYRKRREEEEELLRAAEAQQTAQSQQAQPAEAAQGKAIDRVEAYINKVRRPVINTVIAEALGIKVGTVNESCRRLLQAGRISRVEDRPGMWTSTSYDPAETDSAEDAHEIAA